MLLPMAEFLTCHNGLVLAWKLAGSFLNNINHNLVALHPVCGAYRKKWCGYRHTGKYFINQFTT
jgi:hypothetical protein